MQMMLQEGGVKIWRPRQVSVSGERLYYRAKTMQVYVGAGKRDYVPAEERNTEAGAKNTPSMSISHSG
jgi:citrate synthase